MSHILLTSAKRGIGRRDNLRTGNSYFAVLAAWVSLSLCGKPQSLKTTAPRSAIDAALVVKPVNALSSFVLCCPNRSLRYIL